MLLPNRPRVNRGNQPMYTYAGIFSADQLISSCSFQNSGIEYLKKHLTKVECARPFPHFFAFRKLQVCIRQVICQAILL